MDRQINTIALSGDVGTGTTTLGRNLASSLGWKHVNAGAYFRDWFKEHNIPLEEVDEIPEEIDRELDARFQRDMAELKKYVFESHLAGWLAKDQQTTFKILCIADPAVTMPRIAAREGWELDKAIEFSQKRTEGLSTKFTHLYGVTDPYDPSFFDVTIDTTHLSVGQVLDQALRQVLPYLPDGESMLKVLEL